MNPDDEYDDDDAIKQFLDAALPGWYSQLSIISNIKTSDDDVGVWGMLQCYWFTFCFSGGSQFIGVDRRGRFRELYNIDDPPLTTEEVLDVLKADKLKHMLEEL